MHKFKFLILLWIKRLVCKIWNRRLCPLPPRNKKSKSLFSFDWCGSRTSKCWREAFYKCTEKWTLEKLKFLKDQKCHLDSWNLASSSKNVCGSNELTHIWSAEKYSNALIFDWIYCRKNCVFYNLSLIA